MSFFKKMAKFQDSRISWAILVFVSVALVVIAHSLFQNYAYMPPCEQCVYIRFAFLCMALGGVIAIINPKNLLFALVGYVFAFWGAVHGDDPFGVQGCSTEPHYPFGLPLEKWAPDWFMPTGDCGYDSPMVPDGAVLSDLQKSIVDLYADGWYLVPSSKFMSMADCTLLGFGVCFVVLALMLVSKLLSFKK